MSSLLIVPIGLLLDRLLGEPERWHPLAGFGQYANWLERRMNTAQDFSARIIGIAAVLLAIGPFVTIAYWLSSLESIGFLVDVILLYFALGAKSLRDHALRVFTALKEGLIEQARYHTSMIVSRDVSKSNENELSRATIESVLENGCDAIFGTLFWFAIAGAPGVILYRLSNTLDAMWGYKTSRFLHFGWAAARLDDLLNYVPARLTAFTYAIAGNFSLSWTCMRQQAPAWKSPNAGLVMASGAGSLDLQLGGAAHYHGKLEHRPELGCGNQANSQDILRATTLIRNSILIWIAVLVVIWGLMNIA